jgi:amino acid transporter
MVVVAEQDVGTTEELGEKRLSLIDVIAQSLGFVGPVFSAAFIIPLVVGAGAAGKGSGVATPITIVLAAIAVGGIAWVISRYARRIAAAGALYDYVSHGFGREVGAIAGWVYYGGVLALTLAISLFIGGITSDYISGEYDVDIPYWLLDFVYIALVSALLYFGVRLSTRSQLVLVVVSMLFIVGFMLYVIVEAPAQSGEPFNPGAAEQGSSGIFYGVLYAILIFVGFETAANLAEETDRPKRNIPLAIYISLGLVTAYYVLVAYAQAVGFELDPTAWVESVAPIFALASPDLYGSTTLSRIIQPIVILDIFAVGLGCSVAASRGIFALARDRRIPGAFARVDPHRGTPVAAIAFIALGGVVLVLLARLGGGVLTGEPEYFPLFAWLAAFGAFSLVAVYGTVCVGGLRGLWDVESRVPLVVAVVLGTAGSVGALFGSIYKVPSPTSWVPWVVLGWTAAGVVLTFALRAMGRLHPAVGLATEGAPEAYPGTVAADERAGASEP